MDRVSVKISATIANEWASRGIHDVVPDLPDWDYNGCVLQLPLSVAREVLADCEFNGNSRSGPEDMPPGTRRAYQALAKRLRKLPGIGDEKLAPASSSPLQSSTSIALH